MTVSSKESWHECRHEERSTLNESWHLILIWLFSNQLFRQRIVFTERLNASRYRYDCSNQLYRQKDCICHAIDFQIRSRCTTCSWLDHFFVIVSCQCRCLISWYVNFNETFFFLLIWTSQKARRRLTIIIMQWVHSFEFYMFRLHTFDCFEFWAIHI